MLTARWRQEVARFERPSGPPTGFAPMMMYPFATAATGGVLLLLQRGLGFAVSGQRNKTGVWIGFGGESDLERSVRRHANLAENAGLFVAALAIMELSGRLHSLLLGLCITLTVAQFLHAAGLSQANTRNLARLAGSLLTTGTGVVLAVALLWISMSGTVAR